MNKNKNIKIMKVLYIKELNNIMKLMYENIIIFNLITFGLALVNFKEEKKDLEKMNTEKKKEIDCIQNFEEIYIKYEFLKIKKENLKKIKKIELLWLSFIVVAIIVGAFLIGSIDIKNNTENENLLTFILIITTITLYIYFLFNIFLKRATIENNKYSALFNKIEDILENKEGDI